MDDLRFNSYIRNITTPINPTSNNKPTATLKKDDESSVSFNDLLQEKLKQNSSIEFSKHAMNRVAERNIDLSSDKLERLNNGVKLAEEKGLNDTLIIIDQLAFVVNIKNNKVITTVSDDALRGNVFTNIDGTVII